MIYIFQISKANTILKSHLNFKSHGVRGQGKALCSLSQGVVLRASLCVLDPHGLGAACWETAGGKKWEKPPWGLLDFAQRVNFRRSGPPLPDLHETFYLAGPLAPCWLGVWLPAPCLGVVATGPLAAPGHCAGPTPHFSGCCWPHCHPRLLALCPSGTKCSIALSNLTTTLIQEMFVSS